MGLDNVPEMGKPQITDQRAILRTAAGQALARETGATVLAHQPASVLALLIADRRVQARADNIRRPSGLIPVPHPEERNLPPRDQLPPPVVPFDDDSRPPSIPPEVFRAAAEVSSIDLAGLAPGDFREPPPELFAGESINPRLFPKELAAILLSDSVPAGTASTEVGAVIHQIAGSHPLKDRRVIGGWVQSKLEQRSAEILAEEPAGLVTAVREWGQVRAATLTRLGDEGIPALREFLNLASASAQEPLESAASILDRQREELGWPASALAADWPEQLEQRWSVIAASQADKYAAGDSTADSAVVYILQEFSQVPQRWLSAPARQGPNREFMNGGWTGTKEYL